jgi:Ca-activated chloride channel homolog
MRKHLMVLFALLLTSGCGELNPVATARAAEPPLSPTAVLQSVDATLGSTRVNFPRGPNDRAEAGLDKTLSPYFYVPGAEPGAETLPLKETSANVQIAGVIAKVKVRQVFENSGVKPIEAIYVFPASSRAAVHGMRMKIGSRTIEAKIERKAKARAEYEEAKREGKRASLLEQERPNVFTMNVANIMPKDRIEVELDYSELLVPEDAVYEFVYPTVVGPRYGGGADPQKDKWIANPYLTEGRVEPYKFDIRVHVETGISLKDLGSPSHKVKIDYTSKSSADVALDQEGGGNKDYILRYRLAGDQVDTGLLLYRGEQENFFILMMEPPARPTDKQIPPREYIFLLDVSGSMHGFPLNTSKELAKNLLTKLRPTDLVNIVMFSGGNFVMGPEGSLPATPANIETAVDLITRQQGRGGTELMGGLRAAYGIPRKNKQYSRTVIVVTDGYVGVEAQAFKFIRDNLNQANLFAFGIGSAVNRGLIEGMARAGMGEPFVVLNPGKAAEQAEKLRAYIQYPVLSHVEVKIDGFDALEIAPEKVPDVMAQRPVVLFGKYRGEATGKLEVSGYSGTSKLTKTVEVASGTLKPENAPLRFLWARKWVAILDDESHMARGNPKIEEAITRLGLEYTLLTTFTSFVAVDSEVVNKGGDQATVNQALPLPEGVSNLAVGGGQGASGMPAPMARPMVRSRAASAMPSEARPSMAPSAPSATLESAAASDAPAAPSAAGGMAMDSGVPSGSHAEKSKAEPKRPAQVRYAISEIKAPNLSDTKPLVAAIEAALREAVARGCRDADGAITVYLTIDKEGKVVKVASMRADNQQVSDCLEQVLKTVQSTAKPSGTDVVTVELKLRVMVAR